MIRINENYSLLQGSYLFSEIAKRVKEYQVKNPGKKVLRLGIGDVTKPLAPSSINGLKSAVDEMASQESFRGYGPDYASRGCGFETDEIFISTGAKEDAANIQELFAGDASMAITDPEHPVYVDSNVMAGRAGKSDGKYENIAYLPCNEANNFKPSLPGNPVDLIYICFPNNPTGQVLKKDELKIWVDCARKNKALILFDSAFEAFIRDDSIPRSISEVDGARDVAVEFRTLSKTAGFIGTRCYNTVVPKTEWRISSGKPHTRFFTGQERTETRAIVDYYLENERIIGDGIGSLGLKYSGGANLPNIWFKTPAGLSSWDFFDSLLDKCQVVGTPGAGFGRNGEGYFRLSTFGKKEDVIEAVDRIKKFKI